MDMLFFLGAALFPFLPRMVKGKFDFIDIILLLFLYVDISLLYVAQFVNYTYFIYFIVFIYSLKSLFIDQKYYPGYFVSVKNVAYAFLAAFLLFPIFHNENISQSTRFFATTFTSIILLPLALKYYSTKGDIRKLLRFGYYFILVWCLFVIFATAFKLGGEASEAIGGKLFYFGRVAIRGGITYISFALLLVPLIFKLLKKREKIILLCCTAMIFAVFIASLKRFVFIIIPLAVANYLFRSKANMGSKIGIVAAMIVLILILPSNPTLKNEMAKRYEERGAERKYSFEAVEGDIRIEEPLIAIEYMSRFGLLENLVGIETNVEIKIDREGYSRIKRAIHNEYAMLFMKFGLIGVMLYVALFAVFYRKIAKLKKKLTRMKVNVNEYWIVFQNLVLIFLIEGMVGGHSHITFRGLVFLYSGAIAGHFYQLVKANTKQAA